MNWEKLCPNLRFTAENKMEHLHKAGHISTSIWWMRYPISSNFKNLSMNWIKYVFYLEKWNFETTGNFAHITKFLTLQKALLILLPLNLQILIMLTSPQTDNKYRKNAANKKVLLKNGSEVLKHKFNILCQITFIFLIKCQPFGVQRPIRQFWIMIICFNLLRNKNFVHKIKPEAVDFISFGSKFKIISIYLSFVSFIWYNLWKYIPQLRHRIKLLVHR